MAGIWRNEPSARRNGGSGVSTGGPDLKNIMAAGTMRSVAERLDKLMLISEALWSLVREKTGLGEEDLLKRMEELDPSDGAEDGKSSKKGIDCKKCGRTVSMRYTRCLYCGARHRPESAFDIL